MSRLSGTLISLKHIDFIDKIKVILYTPGPQLMRIHLVQNSTSAKFQKSPNINLVRPIIHLVGNFALSD